MDTQNRLGLYHNFLNMMSQMHDGLKNTKDQLIGLGNEAEPDDIDFLEKAVNTFENDLIVPAYKKFNEIKGTAIPETSESKEDLVFKLETPKNEDEQKRYERLMNLKKRIEMVI